VAAPTSWPPDRRGWPSVGKPIVIENNPAPAATSAAEYVARAAPDGYTLWYGTNARTASTQPVPNLPASTR